MHLVKIMEKKMVFSYTLSDASRKGTIVHSKDSDQILKFYSVQD